MALRVRVLVACVGVAAALAVQPPWASAINSPNPDWVAVSSIPIGVQDIAFTDAQHGWAVGYDGLASTADAGQTWTQVALPASDAFQRVLFTDSQHGYITGGNTLLFTSDGGTTWHATRTRPPMGYNDLGDVASPSSGVLFAVGQRSGVFESLDSGATWHNIDPPDAPPNTTWYRVVFTSPKDGWMLDSYGAYRTDDGGVTWKGLNLLLFADEQAFPATDLAFDGSSGIASASGVAAVITTTDYGATWGDMAYLRNVSTQMQGVQSVAAGPPGQYLVSTGTDLYSSADGGQTWRNASFPVGTNVISAVGFSGMAPYAVADDRFFRLSGYVAPPNGPLKVHVGVSPNHTTDGQLTTVLARTNSGAQCRVEVLYYRTPHAATSHSLRPVEVAGHNGQVRWTWKPDTKRTGPAVATVRCVLGSRTGSGQASFWIR